MITQAGAHTSIADSGASWWVQTNGSATSQLVTLDNPLGHLVPLCSGEDFPDPLPPTPIKVRPSPCTFFPLVGHEPHLYYYACVCACSLKTVLTDSGT